jgi:hypothetical protein
MANLELGYIDFLGYTTLGMDTIARDTTGYICASGIGYVKKEEYTKPSMEKYFTPKKVIFNGTTTIVYWSDDTKTVVKCNDRDCFSEEGGLQAAITKRIFDQRSMIENILKGALRQRQE